MKIALGSDHAGYELKAEVNAYLVEKGYSVLDLGCHGPESVDYPDYGRDVALKVASAEADLGIVICGTGIGISLAANKVKGIRAALCHNGFTAKMARMHNDANILAMGARVIGGGVALEMVELFISTAFEGGRHKRRVDKIMKLEEA